MRQAAEINLFILYYIGGILCPLIISTFPIISTPFFSEENVLIWGRGGFCNNK